MRVTECYYRATLLKKMCKPGCHTFVMALTFSRSKGDEDWDTPNDEWIRKCREEYKRIVWAETGANVDDKADNEQNRP